MGQEVPQKEGKARRRRLDSGHFFFVGPPNPFFCIRSNGNGWFCQEIVMTALAQPTILYVDDDEVTRRAMQRLFQGAGFQFKQACTGIEALRLAREQPDLVLLDVHLPDISGFEVCRRIKSEPATATIPVLHLSAMYTTTEDRTQGLEGGADGYLIKPVNPKELVAHVRAHLRIRQAEEETRAVARQWQTTFDAIGDGVCLVNGQGQILRCNKVWERIMARPAREMIEHSLLDFFPIAPAFASDQGPYRRQAAELALEDHWFEVVADPILDQTDNLSGAVYILVDVSERKRLEEQLRQAQKMQAVGQLAGGVAHDFNNLLTAILGSVSMLLEEISSRQPEGNGHRGVRTTSDLPLATDLVGGLKTIEKASLRAAELVRQLLGFSRQNILWLQPLHLHGGVEETVRILQRTIDPRITVVVKTTPDLWTVQADSSQVNQVLMNLCLNARDAMPEGGRLLLETENVEADPEFVRRHAEARPGQFVRLRVSDTGQGIPEEIQSRIFEPFFTTKGPDKGTGLGLSMVFGIVKQHQGWIECSSTPGRGTTFDVYLPRCSGERPAVVSFPTTPPLRPNGKETILLVDDEDMIRNLCRLFLEQAGYQVILAEDGQKAVELFRREHSRIDLVILDLSMPRLSGRDTLGRLVRIDPSVRVLVSSGYAAEEKDTSDIEGVLGFIPKPYRRIDLLTKVRTTLDGVKERAS
jgi:two-component system cell cycle sensor histidine kinase/response regulator CckA